jgi:hypothetical protein
MSDIQTAAQREHMIALLKRWVPMEYHWMLRELEKPALKAPTEVQASGHGGRADATASSRAH